MCQLAAPVSRMMKNYQKMTIVMPVVQEGLKRCIAILLQVQVCELIAMNDLFGSLLCKVSFYHLRHKTFLILIVICPSLH